MADSGYSGQVRIGVVGAGAVATRHVETVLAFGDVEVAGVADVDPGRAADLAERCGGRAYREAGDLIAGERLDALYICVPPFAHGAPEQAALDAGLPFLVEKPLAADLATAEGIAERVAASGVPTSVGYHWRYLDTLERARELLAERPAQLVVLSWLDKVPPPPWWRQRALSGGQTVEQTTHVLDTARALLGEVTRVSAETGRRPVAEGDVPEVTAASLRFASGAVGSVVSTSLLPAKHAAGVSLFADGLAVELSEEELVVHADGVRRAFAAEGSAKSRLDRDFLDVVAGRATAVRVDYAEALRTHRLACALTESAESGRPIELAHG